MLVGLADRQHGQIHGRLLLQGGQQLIRGVTIRGRPKLGFDRPDGRRGGRQRRIEIGLQPCQGCRRPGLPVHQVQVRIRRSWLELHAQPASVLQPAADLGRDVLAIRHGGVVAEREVDPALPGHLRLGLSAQRECSGMPSHAVRNDGIGRTVPLQGNRYRLPQRLVRPHARGRRPFELQHPRAAQHVLVKPLMVS